MFSFLLWGKDIRMHISSRNRNYCFISRLSPKYTCIRSGNAWRFVVCHHFNICHEAGCPFHSTATLQKKSSSIISSLKTNPYSDIHIFRLLPLSKLASTCRSFLTPEENTSRLNCRLKCHFSRALWWNHRRSFTLPSQFDFYGCAQFIIWVVFLKRTITDDTGIC